MFTLTPQNTKLSQRLAVPYKGKAGIGEKARLSYTTRGEGSTQQAVGHISSGLSRMKNGTKMSQAKDNTFFWIVLFHFFLIEDCVEYPAEYV